MSEETILLTGATGFVGFRILEKLLERGSHLRLAVRSESKASALKQALETSKHTAKIDHVTVPDMTKEGAFDEAVKGVTYVVHVASPLPAPSDDLEASIIKPAVAVTTSLLNTLLQSSERTVKKVVITSSIAAVIPEVPKVWDADEIVPDPTGPWTVEFPTYVDSKKLALSATRRIIQEHNPYFQIINVMPSFIIGPHNFAQSRKDYESSSNLAALAPLLGMELKDGRPNCACHVDDVATVHVAALDPSVTGHRNFGVNYEGLRGVDWNTAIDIVKEKLPDAVGPNGYPLGGHVALIPTAFDASKTERELGIKFKDFETMVVDVAKAYLEVKA